MKIMKFMVAGIVLAAFLGSCEKDQSKDSDLLLSGDKKAIQAAVTENMASTPVSDEGVMPYIIPGKNKGGNRTCSEVGMAFMNDPEYFAFCGQKLDYEDGEFSGEFPEGLNVTVDGKYVSFDSDNCIMIGDKSYKVGAVIVKGGPNANVYFYPEGSYGDSNLAAPVNGGGRNAGLSNLTFCFVECEMEELIIAVKTYYWDSNLELYRSALSTGTVVFTDGWCADWSLGYNDYPGTAVFDLHHTITNKVGEVEVEDGTITITMNEGFVIDYTYLYIGTLENFENDLSNGCPKYWTWMLNDEDGASQVFTP